MATVKTEQLKPAMTRGMSTLCPWLVQPGKWLVQFCMRSDGRVLEKVKRKYTIPLVVR